MKNILIIVLVLFGLGYMGSILLDRYQTIKTTNETIKLNQQPSR